MEAVVEKGMVAKASIAVVDVGFEWFVRKRWVE
jgi:hypothetical protein